MKSSLRIILVLCLLLLSGSISYAHTLSDWKALETEYFLVYYLPDYEHQALETLYYLEEYRTMIEELTGNYHHQQTSVVIQDLGMIENAYAAPLAHKIGIFIGNPSTYTMFHTQESWLRLLAVHEYTHIKQLTYASGISGTLTSIFGSYFAPNLFIPHWMVEGIAIYAESQVSPFEGRLNDGYYEALIAAKASEGRFPSIYEADYYHHSFPGGLWYLAGAGFFQYLADHYGEELFAEYFTIYSNYWWAPILPFPAELFPYLTYDRAARAVYGKSFKEIYREWQEYEEQRHQGWVMEGEELLSTQRGTIHSLTSYDGYLYFFRRDVFSHAPFSYRSVTSLIQYEPKTGTERLLIEFTPGGSPHTPLTIFEGKIYYALQELRKGYGNTDNLGFGVEATIYSYDLETGSVEEHVQDRIKAFTILHDGTILYAVDSIKEFGSLLYRVREGREERLGQVSELISELVTYEEDIIIVSKGPLSNYNISFLYLSDLSIEKFTQTPWIEKGIMVNNNDLYYGANYHNEYALYRYNFDSRVFYQLTHGGFAIQVAPIDELLYFVGVGAEGQGLYCKERDDVVVDSPHPSLPQAKDFHEVLERAQPVHALMANTRSMLFPHTRFYPVLAYGEDDLGMNSYVLDYLGNISITSTLFQPLTLRAMANPLLHDYTIQGEYPLYHRLQAGLSYIGLLAQVDSSSTLLLGGEVGFSYPRQELSFALYGSVDQDSSPGLLSEAYFNYYMHNGSLRLRARFTENFFDQEGLSTEADIYYKLGEIRRGIYNPHLFVGDLYGNLSFKTKMEQPPEMIHTLGMAFVFEVGVASNYLMTPSIGITLKGDEASPFLQFSLTF